MVPLESKGRRLYDAMYDACPPPNDPQHPHCIWGAPLGLTASTRGPQCPLVPTLGQLTAGIQ